MTSARLLSRKDLERVPDADWLVEGHIPSSGLIVLYGQPATWKTFLAADLALSVASGKTWQGKCEVKGGSVIYVAAEGSSGIKARVRSWEAVHNAGSQVEAFYTYDQAFDLRNEAAVSEFLKLVSPFEPRLIVFDTLARCLPGADENSAKDMGSMVAEVDRIRHALSCAVLLVHHSTKNDGSERGSSSLRAASDTIMRVRRRGKRTTLENSKQKEAQEFASWTFELQGFGASCAIRALRQETGPGNMDDKPVREVLRVLEEAGRPVSKRHVRDKAAGGNEALGKTLEDLADDPVQPVTRVTSGSRALFQYSPVN